MDAQGIISQLESYDGSFPRRALEAAREAREEIIPDLLQLLEHAVEHAEELAEDELYMGHLYAMYLLAEFRERRAYPLIVQFFSLPREVALDLTGDVVTESLSRILASVSGGDTSLMASLAEDEGVNEYVRGAALEGLVTLVACGEKRREEVLSYYQSLFRGKLSKGSEFLWAELVVCCTDLYPEEVYEEIKHAYAEDLVDTTIIDLDEVEEYLALGKDEVLARLKGSKYRLIEDTISEMEWWACFEPSLSQQRGVDQTAARSEVIYDPVGRQLPYVAPPKVGRNEPCPCGSGRKYKKCCGSK